MCSSSLARAPKLTSCWIIIDRKTLEPTKKKILHVQRQRGSHNEMRKGTNMIKSNPKPSGWVIHNLENNNIKEVLPLLWRFWALYQASQPGDLAKGLGLPREPDFGVQWNLLAGLSQDKGKQGLHSWRAQTKSCVCQDPGERSSGPTGDWASPTCWCWRVSCGGEGWQWLAMGTGLLGAVVLVGAPWCKSSWRSPLTLP